VKPFSTGLDDNEWGYKIAAEEQVGHKHPTCSSKPPSHLDNLPGTLPCHLRRLYQLPPPCPDSPDQMLLKGQNFIRPDIYKQPLLPVINDKRPDNFHQLFFLPIYHLLFPALIG
jgi:hypothetical protein